MLTETENNIDFLSGLACRCGSNGADHPPCEACQTAHDLKTELAGREELWEALDGLISELDLTGQVALRGPWAAQGRRVRNFFAKRAPQRPAEDPAGA